MARRHDLTGPWWGRYEGDAGVESNRFVALLTDSAGVIGGSVSEPDDLGLAPLRHAHVSGRRSDSAVRFVKQYDGAVLAHAVDYRGTLSEDGTRLAGTWFFARYRGTFVMEREIFAEEELADEMVLDAPVPERVER